MTATGPTIIPADLYKSFPLDASRSALCNPCGKSARPTGRDIAVPMQVSKVGIPLDNKLLASLPRGDFDRLLPHLSTITLQQGSVLIEAGDEVDHIYFPHYGMLSLLAVLRDGKAIETATVGREGVVGAMAGLGLYKSLVRVVVQMPTASSKIAATHFRTVAATSDPVRNLSSGTTKCCCRRRGSRPPATRCIRSRPDFAGGFFNPPIAPPATPCLTQEFLAEMLGVRRTSVTEVASKVQSAGAITYSRGVIKILDRAALMRMSCECYETLVEQSALLT